MQFLSLLTTTNKGGTNRFMFTTTHNNRFGFECITTCITKIKDFLVLGYTKALDISAKPSRNFENWYEHPTGQQPQKGSMEARPITMEQRTKKQQGYRFSEQTQQLIEAMATRTNTTKTQVIETCVAVVAANYDELLEDALQAIEHTWLAQLVNIRTKVSAAEREKIRKKHLVLLTGAAAPAKAAEQIARDFKKLEDAAKAAAAEKAAAGVRRRSPKRG
jgi:hypothetical protein